MNAQIPFAALTGEALGRLSPDERLAFEAAAVAVAGDQKPSLEVIATLVLTVQRLISEPARMSEQWAVAWGSGELNDGKGFVELYDDEQDARADLGFFKNGRVVRRTIIALAWQAVPDAEPGRE